MRGIWRETKGSDEAWWAHVETAPGAWTDISQDEYLRVGCQPPFDDLPLKEDHLNRAMSGGTALEAETSGYAVEKIFNPAAQIIIIACLAGLVVFVVYVAMLALQRIVGLN